MENYEHIHIATNKKLAGLLQELSRRHVDEEREILLEAARRIEAYNNTSEFNHEEFSCP